LVSGDHRYVLQPSRQPVAGCDLKLSGIENNVLACRVRITGALDDVAQPVRSNPQHCFAKASRRVRHEFCARHPSNLAMRVTLFGMHAISQRANRWKIDQPKDASYCAFHPLLPNMVTFSNLLNNYGPLVRTGYFINII